MPRVTITVADKTPQPYRFSLDKKIVTLGRAEDNDIMIDCPSVSGHHAEMHRVEGGFELRDCDSTNGIKLNGTAARLITLRNDRDVLLGDVDFDFLLKDDELAILASESPLMDANTEPLPPIGKNEPEDDSEKDVTEEDDYSDEPKPKPKEKAKPASYQSNEAESPVKKALRIVLYAIVAILIAGAFVLGVGARYKSDTGDSFIKSVVLHLIGVDKSPEEDSE